MAGSVERRDEVSPELALVDPELRLRLRLCLAAEEVRLAPPPRRRGFLVRWVAPACALFVVLYAAAFAFARMPSAAGAPPPRVVTPVKVRTSPAPVEPAPVAVPAQRPRHVRLVPLVRNPASVRPRPPWRETEPNSDLLVPLASAPPP